jgi:DnaK suppressor protein
MDKNEKIKIEKNLKSSIGETQQNLIKLKELTKPISPDNAIGRLSRMEAINEKSVNERAVENIENKLVRLKEALHRIEIDEYGECVNCEEPISKARLRVIPESAICLKCATAREE